jgi:hypothetical protein
MAESVALARDSGIANVIFIVDASLEVPATRQLARMHGSIIFPNSEVSESGTEIDTFMAAAHGQAAFQVPFGVEKAWQGVFTHCFLQAFRSPDKGMIKTVVQDGQTIEVVPNRNLAGYLRREMAAVLNSVNVQLRQIPIITIESGDDVYIARVRGVE